LTNHLCLCAIAVLGGWMREYLDGSKMLEILADLPQGSYAGSTIIIKN
jgi:hypothetical protein